MAIKGKKKSQTRGSQARRRPATAPRPTVAGRRRIPWYQTSGGRVALAIAIAIFAGSIVGVVGIVNSNANKREDRQAILEDYSNRVRSLSAFVATPVGEMTQLTTVPEGSALEDLGDTADGWVQTLGEAEGRLAAVGPNVGPPGVFELLSQSISLYSSAAKTYKLLPKSNEEIRADVYGRAVDQKDRAEAIWTQAVAAIDRARDDVGLDASGLGTPGASLATQPPAPPSPAVTPGGVEEDEVGGAGGKGDKGGGGAGDKGGGDKDE